jgi:hypothetical protein
MRKTYWFTVAAVALALLVGAGGWTVLNSPAGAAKAVGSSVQIDPLQAMKNAKNLPTAHYDDYSVVFK